MGCRTLTDTVQVLGITCDNASCNDTMIEELIDQIGEFPGEANRTRCFNHIVALVAVRVVRQFDVPKKDNMDGTNDAENELRELAEGSDIEEAVSQTEWESTEGDDEDDVDGVEWQDDETTVLDRETLNTSLKLGRMLMIKVCREQKKTINKLTSALQLRKISFAIIHSSTILLPMWFETLEKLKMKAAKMPRDVRTRWNSTYDMLEFAVRYRVAIDEITGSKKADLHRYELDGEEWRVAEQLCAALKVRATCWTLELALTFYGRCSKRRHCSSLEQRQVSPP